MRLQSLLPNFCVMSFVVLDNRGTDLYSDGLSLAAAVPAPPFQIVRSSRTVHSSDNTEAWTIWIARIDGANQRRADPRQADLRPLRLLEKGEDPDVLSFADPKVAPNQMAFQCASSWRENALSKLASYLPPNFSEVPGQNIRGSSQIFPIIPRDIQDPLITEMGRAPEFFFIPISWWRGQGFTPSGTTRVFEVWVTPDKKLTESPYVFTTLTNTVCQGSPVSSLFDRPCFGIQPVAANRWRMLAGPMEIAAVRAALPSLKKERGLRFRDEESGLYLDDEDPDGVYVSGVPPYWQAEDLCVALGLPPASTSCAQVQFSLGDLRSTSWVLKGENIDRLAGSIHRSQYDTLTVVTAESFKRLKSAALGARAAMGGDQRARPSHQSSGQPGGQFRASYVSAVVGDSFYSTPPARPPPADRPTTPATTVGANVEITDTGGVDELLD